MSEIEHYIGINLAWGCDEETLKGLIEMLRTRPYIDYAVLMEKGPEVKKPEPTRENLPAELKGDAEKINRLKLVLRRIHNHDQATSEIRAIVEDELLFRSGKFAKEGE